MIARSAIWAAGLAGSCLAHAAIAGALLISLRPDPLVDQPTPQSSLTMAAQRLNRSQAIPQETQGQPAPQADPAAISEAHVDAATAMRRALLTAACLYQEPAARASAGSWSVRGR